jgi:hypothetical protein
MGAEIAAAQPRPQDRFAVRLIVTSALAEAKIKVDIIKPLTEVAGGALR